MHLTEAGAGLMTSKAKFSEHDFNIHNHNSAQGECCVVHYTMTDRPLAIHKGTTVELARLWKLALITRRLSQ